MLGRGVTQSNGESHPDDFPWSLKKTTRTAILDDVDSAAAVLADFDILIAMRERMPLPGALIERLPHLRRIALTGVRSGTLDLAACAARGVMVCNAASDHSTAASDCRPTYVASANPPRGQSTSTSVPKPDNVM